MFFILSCRLFAATCKPSSLSTRASQARPRGFVPYSLLFGKAAYTTSRATAEMETVDSSNRLLELRKLMKERDIDIYGRSPLCPYLALAAQCRRVDYSLLHRSSRPVGG